MTRAPWHAEALGRLSLHPRNSAPRALQWRRHFNKRRKGREAMRHHLGGVLIFFGAIFALSGLGTIGVALTADEEWGLRLAVAGCGLLYAVLGAGMTYVGYRLRNPRVATPPVPQAKPSATKPSYRPPKLSPEEIERQRKMREEREREWREREERRKKARMAFLKPWSDIDPDEAERISQWEAALEGDCALKTFYIIGGCGDEGLDGTRDSTGVDWFSLCPGSDLEKAIGIYAQIDTYRKACEVHGTYAKDTESGVLYRLMRHYYDCRFLIVSKQQFDALGENAERCLALCKEHDLHLAKPLPRSRFEDYVSGKTYEIYVAETFPGSADDAATYGSLEMCVVD
ncbi:hypothetical protein GMI68_08295 [Eggerthellaceae bacterium zg-886]|uniref:Uncharacterized protein n=2 Tax=Xiamenia xianingshaonis TaxID=2682776 RepID=A0ABX0IL61_9ACTN|nr:hypothetical protein [Xiamenia xianingshaonis]